MKNRGRRNRQIGQEWECECARLLRRWWPDCKRSSQSSNGTGVPVPDLLETPFWVECGKSSAPLTQNFYWRKYQQACSDREKARDTRPVLLLLMCARQRWVGLEGRDGSAPGLVPLSRIEDVVAGYFDS